MLRILRVFDNALDRMVADGIYGGVKIGRVVKGSGNTLKGVTVFLVNVKLMYYLCNQDLVLLNLTLFLWGTTAKIIVLDGELCTNLHLRAIGITLVNQHISATSFSKCCWSFTKNFFSQVPYFSDIVITLHADWLRLKPCLMCILFIRDSICRITQLIPTVFQFVVISARYTYRMRFVIANLQKMFFRMKSLQTCTILR